MTQLQRLVPGRGLQAQLEGFASLGLDVSRIQAALNLDLGKLSDPASLVPVDAFVTMWAAARRQDQRPGLPTALARVIPFGSFGLIDYLVGSAETIGGAIDSLAQHFRLATYEARIDTQIVDGLCWVRLRPQLELSDDAAEFICMSILQRLALFTDGSLQAPHIQLTRGYPADRVVYEDVTGSAFQFGAPVAGFAISQKSCASPVRSADRHLRETLHHVAASLHLDPGKRSDIEMALRARLRDALAQQIAEPATMAKTIGVSERTLQRRLAEQQLSFTAVVESFRHEEALRLLTATATPLAHVATQLGFSEQSSFTRAFRRWTGSTPAAWRTSQRVQRSRGE